MFRCQQCGEVSAPREKMTRVVTKRRDDGRQIELEMAVCERCVAPIVEPQTMSIGGHVEHEEV